MGSGLFDASSKSTSTDARQAATDNARNLRQNSKYQEAGSNDFTKANITQGNVTLTGINGPVTLGDSSGIAQISQIFADTVQQISSQGNATLRDLLFGQS